MRYTEVLSPWRSTAARLLYIQPSYTYTVPLQRPADIFFAYEVRGGSRREMGQLLLRELSHFIFQPLRACLWAQIILYKKINVATTMRSSGRKKKLATEPCLWRALTVQINNVADYSSAISSPSPSPICSPPSASPSGCCGAGCCSFDWSGWGSVPSTNCLRVSPPKVNTTGLLPPPITS